MIHGSDAASTLPAAWCSLLIFSVVGYVVGGLAGWIVTQSVTARVSEELSAQDEAEAAASIP
jgi:hypothetical protein